MSKHYRNTCSRLLKQSIVRLLQKQVTYSSTLKVDGILSITLDDAEGEEIVIKLHETCSKNSGDTDYQEAYAECEGNDSSSSHIGSSDETHRSQQVVEYRQPPLCPIPFTYDENRGGFAPYLRYRYIPSGGNWEKSLLQETALICSTASVNQVASRENALHQRESSVHTRENSTYQSERGPRAILSPTARTITVPPRNTGQYQTDGRHSPPASSTPYTQHHDDLREVTSPPAKTADRDITPNIYLRNIRPSHRPSSIVTQNTPQSTAIREATRESSFYTQATRKCPSSSQAVRDSSSYNQATREGPFYTQAIREGPSYTQAIREGPCLTQATREGPSHTQAAREGPSYTQATRESLPLSQATRVGPTHIQAIREGPFHTQPIRNSPSLTQNIRESHSSTQPIRESPSLTPATREGPSFTQSIRKGLSLTQASKESSSYTQATRDSPSLTQSIREGEVIITQEPMSMDTTGLVSNSTCIREMGLSYNDGLHKPSYVPSRDQPSPSSSNYSPDIQVTYSRLSTDYSAGNAMDISGCGIDLSLPLSIKLEEPQEVTDEEVDVGSSYDTHAAEGPPSDQSNQTIEISDQTSPEPSPPDGSTQDANKKRRLAAQYLRYEGPVQIKTGGKTILKCSICDHVFDNSNACLNHYKTEHQLFLCHLCFKTFSQRASLLRHLRLHTGSKPYKCTQCNTSFYRLDGLTNHTTRYHMHSKFTCPMCPKDSFIYNDRGGLRQHLKVKHGIYKISFCPYCNSYFSVWSEFLQHRKQCHPEIVAIHPQDSP